MVNRKDQQIFIIHIISALIFYYGLVFMFLIYKFPSSETILNTRLGTILFHSEDRQRSSHQQLVAHVYCYYPKKDALMADQKGEYMLKRVDRIEDCNDWYGIVMKYEAPEMSEKNMLEHAGT